MFLCVQFCSLHITLYTVLQSTHHFIYSSAVYTSLYVQFCSLHITLYTVLQSTHHFTYSSTLHSLYSNAVSLSLPLSPVLSFSGSNCPSPKRKGKYIFSSLHYAVCVCVCVCVCVHVYIQVFSIGCAKLQDVLWPKIAGKRRSVGTIGEVMKLSERQWILFEKQRIIHTDQCRPFWTVSSVT